VSVHKKNFQYIEINIKIQGAMSAASIIDTIFWHRYVDKSKTKKNVLTDAFCKGDSWFRSGIHKFIHSFISHSK